MFYVGQKYISKARFKKKTELAFNLILRFTKWASLAKIAPTICLIDGGYTNRKIIEAVLKLEQFIGFIGRFGKGRNIKTAHFSGLLKDYIKSLNIKKNFKPLSVDGKEKRFHEILITLDYGPTFKLAIILDDPQDIASARPLITNLTTLSSQKIAEYYSLRWKEETYHQAIKDAFFARTHKFRTAKVLSRYLEMINIAYGLCEQRRWAKYQGTVTVFDVKNELLDLAKAQFILNIKGRKISKDRREAILSKFRR